MSNFDLVSSLQALPETDAVEFDGIQFGGATCIIVNQCVALSLQVNILNSIQVLSVCA